MSEKVVFTSMFSGRFVNLTEVFPFCKEKLQVDPVMLSLDFISIGFSLNWKSCNNKVFNHQTMAMLIIIVVMIANGLCMTGDWTIRLLEEVSRKKRVILEVGKKMNCEL